MGKKLKISIGTLEEAGKRFVDAWHQAEKDEESSSLKEYLTFENLEILLKVLTPKRLELLKELRNQGTSSIRQLSKILNRDYSNVHTDVKQLSLYGLIKKTKDEKFFVPWKEIIVHFPLISKPNETPKKPIRKKPVSSKNKGFKKAS